MELKGFKIKLVLLKQSDGNKADSFYDFSDYVQIGFGQVLNLDDTVDTMELQLVGLPFRQEFEPTSMFRVTIYQPFEDEGETSQFEKVYDYVLQQDDVEQPNMAEELYTHNLTLANGAIIAQQKTVDNIAVTYKLQDVALESNDILGVDFNSNNIPQIANANYPDSWLPIKNRNFGSIDVDFWTVYSSKANFYRWFSPIISYPAGILSESNPATEVLDYNLTEIKDIKQNYLYGDGNPVTIDGVTYDTTDFVEFNVPLIAVSSSQEGTRQYTLDGYLPVVVEITDTNLISGNVTTTSYTAYPSKYIMESGQKEIDKWNGNHIEPIGSAIDYRYIDTYVGNHSYPCVVAYQKYDDDIVVSNKVKNRTIRIDFNNNEIHQIDIKIKRDTFTQRSLPSAEANNKCPTTSPQVIWQRTTVTGVEQQKTNTKLEENVDFEINFSFCYYPQNSYLKDLFLQGKQIDAYYLFKKAQLAIMPIKKTSGVAYYDTELPFFVNEADKTLLERTQLIESDFLGKNLWEVFSEIGKYIHAKPRISVETDDNDNMTGRYLVSWLYYGKPDINNLVGTTDSIFNSKFAQEYICELDSYVENYFNLGSYITEMLHISSDSDDSLIYNDVAKLITRYPILEVLNLQVYDSNNVSKDITKYIFEYNIYKTLSYDTNVTPSKHRAIYYHLGSNIIEGMQFVSPQPTGVECAYSMKNILGLVYGISPDNINLNDYVFKLDYRVKDNVRVSITRPDLRKYLLNSQYDSFPVHAQFNQQQEQLVSSDSFGLNAYGKLIRTGNSTYNYYNWTDNINETMNEGDLYNTPDGLYYVSKVSRVYYAEHIEENVELTKDFNRLAQIIGIPSQPRFYEISERNIVNRDVKFNEYVIVSAIKASDFIPSDYAHPTLLTQYAVRGIIYSPYIPDGVVTFFKGDTDKEYDTKSNTECYQIYTPVVSYSSKNTLTLEWDMVDNFSAGDKSVHTNDTLKWGLNLYSMLNFFNQGGNTPDQAYRTKEPTRYVDVYGRSDLVDFLFTKGWGLSYSETYDLPSTDLTNRNLAYVNAQRPHVRGGSNNSASINMSYQGGSGTTSFNQGVSMLMSNDSGYIIAKDNRERLSFNYNIQLLLESDRIVLGNKLWIRDLSNVKTRIVLLNRELNKFDTDLINIEDIIAITDEISNIDIYDYLMLYFDVENNNSFTYEEKTNAMSYAIVRADMVGNNNYRLIIGKNVSDILDVTKKIVDFEFTSYDKSSAKTNRKQLDNITI